MSVIFTLHIFIYMKTYNHSLAVRRLAWRQSLYGTSANSGTVTGLDRAGAAVTHALAVLGVTRTRVSMYFHPDYGASQVQPAIPPLKTFARAVVAPAVFPYDALPQNLQPTMRNTQPTPHAPQLALP